MAADGAEAAVLERTATGLVDEVQQAIESGDSRSVEVRGGELLLVPMREQFGRGGALVLFAPARDHADTGLLTAFAGQAALALEHAQALARPGSCCVTDDRDRIARDLHDLVIQRLFATGLQLQGAAPARRRERGAERIDRAVDDLDDTIREIRPTIFALQHAPASGGAARRGARAALDESAAGRWAIEPDGAPGGPVDTARPATSGRADCSPCCARRSPTSPGTPQADRVDASRSARRRRAGSREVTDDGGGLPERRPAQRPGATCAQRAADLGGDVSPLAPGRARGTRVRWRVPLARAEPGGRGRPVVSCLEQPVASTAAWVRRSRPSLASTLET